jgi:hypothetical protein
MRRRSYFLPLLAAAFLAGCAPTVAEQTADRSSSTVARASGVAEMNHAERFEEIFKSRNAMFESLRRAAFSDPDFVEYLRQRARDGQADDVRAFVAAALYRWAEGSDQALLAFDRFLRVDLFATRAEAQRTAVGWQPRREISRHLQLAGNQAASAHHLLLLTLLHPDLPHVGEGAHQYFSFFAAPEPQAWIRAAMHHAAPGSMESLVQGLVKHGEPARVLRALDAEHGQLVRAQRSLPPELAALRVELGKSR